MIQSNDTIRPTPLPGSTWVLVMLMAGKDGFSETISAWNLDLDVDN